MNNVTFVTASWAECSEDMKKTLLPLSLGDKGMMCDFTRFCPMDLDVAIAMVDSHVIGWSVWNRRDFYTMVFVNPKFRKKGIGKKLMMFACEASPDKKIINILNLFNIPSSGLFPDHFIAYALAQYKKRKALAAMNRLVSQS